MGGTPCRRLKSNQKNGMATRRPSRNQNTIMNETKKSGWRWLRRLLVGGAIFATLIAIFYTEEDWRGRRAWENYKRELEAKGEKLDWQAFVPPSVPDDQNFFTAPVFSNIVNEKSSMTPYGNDGGPDFNANTNAVGYAIYRERFSDLKIWQDYFRKPANIHAIVGLVMTNGAFVDRTNYANHETAGFPIASRPQTPAKDVLLALSKFDSAVEELRQASQRPYANVPLNYEDGFGSASKLLPVLATLKRCTQLLQLRVQAELADGQNDEALADIKLLFYLTGSLHTSPFLISHLVRIAIVAIGIEPIWESLAKHQWTDEQLVELDVALSKINFFADHQLIIRSELAFSIAQIDNWRQQRPLTQASFDSNIADYQNHSFWEKIGNAIGAIGTHLTPSGWFYLNEMAMAQIHQDWDSKMIDVGQMIVFPKKIQQANLSTDKQARPWNIFAHQILPALGAYARKTAQIQGQIDLTRTAIALERYRLIHGNYPETLEVLTPQFMEKIPRDVINGEPLHYRLESNGQFVLYSVGWNEKDDGGQVVLGQNGAVKFFEGDWVWQYPPK